MYVWIIYGCGVCTRPVHTWKPRFSCPTLSLSPPNLESPPVPCSPVLGMQVCLGSCPTLYVDCGDLNSGRHAYSASSLSLRATLKPGKISLDSCLKPNINSFLWSCSFHAQLPALWGEPCVRQQRLLQAGSQWLVEMVTIRVQAVFSKRHLGLSTSQPASLNSQEHPKLWAQSFPFCKQIK